MPEKEAAKINSTLESLKKIGVMGYAMGSAVVGATIFWVNMNAMQADFDQFKLDYKKDRVAQKLESEDKFDTGMAVARELKAELKEEHDVTHDLQLDNRELKTEMKQVKAELANLWKMKNEEYNRELNK